MIALEVLQLQPVQASAHCAASGGVEFKQAQSVGDRLALGAPTRPAQRGPSRLRAKAQGHDNLRLELARAGALGRSLLPRWLRVLRGAWQMHLLLLPPFWQLCQGKQTTRAMSDMGVGGSHTTYSSSHAYHAERGCAASAVTPCG